MTKMCEWEGEVWKEKITIYIISLSWQCMVKVSSIFEKQSISCIKYYEFLIALQLCEDRYHYTHLILKVLITHILHIQMF